MLLFYSSYFEKNADSKRDFSLKKHCTIEQRKQECQARPENAKAQLENTKIKAQAPFPREKEYAAKSKHLEELNIELKSGQTGE